MRLDVKEVARKIIQNNGEDEAFYVCDLEEIIRRHSEWVKHFPRVTPFYAVKCNDAKIVLETLKSLGCGFDCASKSEIEKMISLQVSPSKIIFAHTAKILSHIKVAAKLGVDIVTVDSEPELLKLKEHMPGAKILIRLLSEAEKAGYPLGRKFGVPVRECMQLLRTSKLLGLTAIGISFHVGCECMEPIAYTRAISRAKTLFDYAKNELDLTLNLLDIGGGLHGHDSTFPISHFAPVINSALDKYFPEVGHASVQIVAEPGRYFPTAAFTLFTQIHSKKEISDADGNICEIMYYINDGIYGSFSVMQFDKKKSKLQILNETSNRKIKSTVYGPTCDGRDKVWEDELPKLSVGDWIYFKNMGSYSSVAGGEFNGFPLPKLYAVVTPKMWRSVKDTFESGKVKVVSEDDKVELHPVINVWENGENGNTGWSWHKRIVKRLNGK